VVSSDVFDPDEITSRLFLEPAKVSRRGSRSVDPLIPVTNLWWYRASGTGSVDELVLELVELMESIADRLAELTAEGEASVGISIMRSFDDPHGVDENFGRADVPDNLEKLPGQHQLLGFHLDVDLMRRLAAFDCPIDCDEYG
jgi:Domain of unknown function (DUF4279)